MPLTTFRKRRKLLLPLLLFLVFSPLIGYSATTVLYESSTDVHEPQNKSGLQSNKSRNDPPKFFENFLDHLVRNSYYVVSIILFAFVLLLLVACNHDKKMEQVKSEDKNDEERLV